jgi:hypothetical protein
MKSLLVSLLLLLNARSAMAQEVHLGTSKDKVDEFFIMSRKYHKKENTVEVWDRIKPAEGQLANYRKKVIAQRQKDKATTDGFDKIGYYKRRIEYNCKNKTYRVMECVYYDLYGKELDATDAKEDTKWEAVPLSTIRDDEFRQVCK